MTTAQLLLLTGLMVVVVVGQDVKAIGNKIRQFPCLTLAVQMEKEECKRKFFASFRSNPTADCSVKYQELKQCENLVETRCSEKGKGHRLFSIYEQAKKIVMLYDQEKLYCRDAGLVNKIPDAKRLGSMGCKLEYYTGKQKCIDLFLKRYRQNRGSPSLCRKYEEMNQCFNKNMLGHCSDKAVRRMQFVAKHVFGAIQNFNPFCSNELVI